MKVLIVVDPLNDFCTGGALEVKDGEKIFPYVNSIMSDYDLVIMTSEKHPQDMDAFASNHEGKKPLETYINQQGVEDILWPDHCVDGTFGSEFHKDLDFNQAKTFYIFKKGLTKYDHPYSGFGAEGLKEFLEEKANGSEIDVDVVGLAFDYCVGETAFDSSSYGFNTRVLFKGTKSIAPETEEKMKVKLMDAGVSII